MRKQAPREGEELGLGQGLWRGASGDPCFGKAAVSWSGGKDEVGPSQRHLAPSLELGVTVRGRMVTLAVVLVMTCGCCLLQHLPRTRHCAQCLLGQGSPAPVCRPPWGCGWGGHPHGGPVCRALPSVIQMCREPRGWFRGMQKSVQQLEGGDWDLLQKVLDICPSLHH